MMMTKKKTAMKGTSKKTYGTSKKSGKKSYGSSKMGKGGKKAC